MKYLLIVFVVVCTSYCMGLSAAPSYVQNHGYVLGELNAVEFTGINRKVITGQVSVGNNSFTGRNDGRMGLANEYVLNNPWNFCADQESYKTLEAFIGEFAVIEYRTPKKSSLLQCQSPNEIVGIYSVSRNNQSGAVLESTKINTAGKPYGVSVGRIVNAQKGGIHNDNWSVVIQVGSSGNEFRYLQIVDENIYALALDSLASASKVNLYHVEQIHGSRSSDRSDSYVWKIEVKQGL